MTLAQPSALTTPRRLAHLGPGLAALSLVLSGLAGGCADDFDSRTRPPWAVHVGVFGSVIMLGNTIAWVKLWRRELSLGRKVLWSVLILSLPLLGQLLYFSEFEGSEGTPS